MAALTTTTTTLVLIVLMFGQYNCDECTTPNRSPSYCQDLLDNCTLPARFYFQQFLLTSMDVDFACRMVSAIHGCVGECKQNLTESYMGTIGSRFSDYLCDTSRRDEVKLAFEAKCFEDKSILEILGQGSEDCSQEVGREFELRLTSGLEVCPVVERMINCFFGKFAQFCGADVVSVFQNAVYYTMREAEIPYLVGCFEQHSLVKRAVSTFLAYAKK